MYVRVCVFVRVRVLILYLLTAGLCVADTRSLMRAAVMCRHVRDCLFVYTHAHPNGYISMMIDCYA